MNNVHPLWSICFKLNAQILEILRPKRVRAGPEPCWIKLKHKPARRVDQWGNRTRSSMWTLARSGHIVIGCYRSGGGGFVDMIQDGCYFSLFVFFASWALFSPSLCLLIFTCHIYMTHFKKDLFRLRSPQNVTIDSATEN